MIATTARKTNRYYPVNACLPRAALPPTLPARFLATRLIRQCMPRAGLAGLPGV